MGKYFFCNTYTVYPFKPYPIVLCVLLYLCTFTHIENKYIYIYNNVYNEFNKLL